MSNNFYEVLGVSPSASADAIKARYRFLSHAFHPDKFPSEALKQEADLAFKQINEAYQVLSDPQRRAAYDLMLTTQRKPRTITHSKKTVKDKQECELQIFHVGEDTSCNSVLDNRTGLMWLKNLDAIRRTWSDACVYCSELDGSAGGKGYDGWRLPTIYEL